MNPNFQISNVLSRHRTLPLRKFFKKCPKRITLRQGKTWFTHFFIARQSSPYRTLLFRFQKPQEIPVRLKNSIIIRLQWLHQLGIGESGVATEVAGFFPGYPGSNMTVAHLCNASIGPAVPSNPLNVLEVQFKVDKRSVITVRNLFIFIIYLKKRIESVSPL